MNAPHPSDLTPDAKVTAVDAAMKLLMEHFDCVQFLGSFCDDEDLTITIYRGAGNWMARQGMAQDFLNGDQAKTQAKELKAVLPPPDDDEQWKR